MRDILQQQVESPSGPSLHRVETEQRLRHILENETFSFVFQPICDLQTGSISGLEVLCRFEDKPYRPPNEWFTDAERYGLGVQLEEVVLRRAVAHLAELPEPLYLSVNASPAAIETGRVANALHGSDLSRLILEVTEHTNVCDEHAVLDQLARLRSQGMRLAVDDVGAGFAGLQQLVRLNPDVIKLDITLTGGIDSDPIKRSLAAAMLGFAKETGASVVGEGIETQEELRTLRELGVCCGQGYFLGHPTGLHEAVLHRSLVSAPAIPSDTKLAERSKTGATKTNETSGASDLLRMTLDHMDQGILVVDADLTVPILSERAARLIDLPVAFAANPPTFPDILAHQVKVGAISAEYRNSSINQFILDNVGLNEAHTYTRKTKSGRWLDVRTTPLPAGGFVRTFTDQTTRHRIEEQRKLSDDAYRALFENATVGIYRCAMDGELLRINPALVSMHAYACETDMLQDIAGQAGDWYIERERRTQFTDLLQRNGRVTDFVSEVYRLLTRERIWISESAWLIHDAAGNPNGYEGMVIDVTERIKAVDLVKHAAEHDALTELRNRSSFNATMEDLSKQEETFALLYLDLDRFKPINDTYGHKIGDDVLVAVARRLQGVLRQSAKLFRIGGDEFAVLLPQADQAHAERVSARLIDALARPIIVGSQRIDVGLSIGVALSEPEDRGSYDLVQAADTALYAAKVRSESAFCSA